MKKRTKPYTNKELFELICEKLKQSNKLPDILDYHLACSDVTYINSYEWEVVNALTYGGSEGIYLNLFVKGIFDGENKIIKLGTFKTLYRHDEYMKKMAILLADFLIEIYKFVNENFDEFDY